jgi:hypothetical protein
MRALLLIVVAGCATPYVAGQIEQDKHTPGHQFGCVEIGALAARRAEAHGPVLVVYVGNLCDHSVAIDMSKLSVVGGNYHGATTVMVPYDPDHEIEPVRINGFASGEEWIELSGTTPVEDVGWLEVDIGSVVPEVPATKTIVRVVIPRSA